MNRSAMIAGYEIEINVNFDATVGSIKTGKADIRLCGYDTIKRKKNSK